MLYDTLIDFTGTPFDFYGNQLEAPSTLPADQTYPQVDASCFPSTSFLGSDEGFQGALGFQPYFGLAYPNPDVASETSTDPREKLQTQTLDFDDFVKWRPSGSF